MKWDKNCSLSDEELAQVVGGVNLEIQGLGGGDYDADGIDDLFAKLNGLSGFTKNMAMGIVKNYLKSNPGKIDEIINEYSIVGRDVPADIMSILNSCK